MRLGGPPWGPPPEDLRGPPPILGTIFIRRSKPRMNLTLGSAIENCTFHCLDLLTTSSSKYSVTTYTTFFMPCRHVLSKTSTRCYIVREAITTKSTSSGTMACRRFYRIIFVYSRTVKKFWWYTGPCTRLLAVSSSRGCSSSAAALAACSSSANAKRNILLYQQQKLYNKSPLHKRFPGIRL